LDILSQIETESILLFFRSIDKKYPITINNINKIQINKLVMSSI